MKWPWLGKRNPEKALENLSAALQAALGKRLESIVVFGSYLRNDYDPRRSNINVLIVSDLAYDALALMGPAIKKWMTCANTPPVLVARDDLDDFARDFPIEFLDMQDHHKVIAGKDPLASLKVNRKHLESQVEHDLALVQLRVRQAIAMAGGNIKKVQQALSASVVTVGILLKAALRLEDESAAGLDKMQAAEKLGAKLHFDAAVLNEAAALRNQKCTVPVQTLASQYLQIMEQVLTHLRKNNG